MYVCMDCNNDQLKADKFTNKTIKKAFELLSDKIKLSFQQRVLTIQNKSNKKVRWCKSVHIEIP